VSSDHRSVCRGPLVTPVYVSLQGSVCHSVHVGSCLARYGGQVVAADMGNAGPGEHPGNWRRGAYRLKAK
jgi:hypothetical protein